VAGIPFVPPLDVVYGAVEQVSPRIRRVVAENPSKFTYLGTGTYIVGHGTVAVIDPGPALDSHFEALIAALAGERVGAILVTHCHADHSPLAARLQSATGAATYAQGPAGPVVEAIEGEALEESVDTAFVPDVRLRDGEVVSGSGWTVRALHTPGHASNHLCFALAEEAAVFTGDHVMGWSTSVIAPPDGDMRAYLASLERIAAMSPAVLWPTHGGPVTDPGPFLASYLEHRRAREAQILDLVRHGVPDIPSMVAVLYAGVREELHKPAGRSVFAHLTKLVADGAVAVGEGDEPAMTSTYVTG
jgi:glyoxylase-like metal-dependent hydrolase (beta-lactamase superfamily II)